MTACTRLLVACSLLVFASTILVARQANEPVYKPGNGVTAPIAIKEVKPDYTPEAKQAKIEGTVVLECVVQTNGEPGDIKVVKSLDREYGLDNKAVEALKQWRFAPGKKDGKPVAVLVVVEMRFTLR